MCKKSFSLALLSALIWPLCVSTDQFSVFAKASSDATKRKQIAAAAQESPLETLKRRVEANPKDASAYYALAQYYTKVDKRDLSIQNYTKAIEFDPKFGEAYRHRAEMYLMTNRFEKSLADCNKLIALYPVWPYAWSKRGRLERRMQLYSQSIVDNQKSLSIDPRDTLASSELAADFDELGQHQTAIDTATINLNMTKEDDPRNLYFALHERGLIFAHAHQLADAEADLKSALMVNRRDAAAYAYLAYTYAIADRVAEAEAESKKSLEYETYNPRGHRLVGEMYRAAGLWEKSLPDYDVSITGEPTYGPGWLQRGISKMALGRLNDARSDMDKAVELDPHSALARSYLAVAQDQTGNQAEARKNIDQAITETPQLAMVWDNKARIALHHGDAQSAIQDLNHAIELDNYSPDAYELRGRLLASMHENDEAKKDQQRAIELGWKPWKHDLEIASQFPNIATTSLPRPEMKHLEPSGSMDFPGTRLTDAQYWALACSDLWTQALQTDTERKVIREDILSVWPGAPGAIKYAQGLLKARGITDRASLDRVLAKQPKASSAEFEELGRKLSGMKESEIQSFKNDPANYFDSMRMDIVAKNYKRLGAKGIKGFDLVNYIALCRFAVCAGYIDEKTAWDKIMPVAFELRELFDSWDELADNYVVGHEFYYQGAASNEKDFVTARQALLNAPLSPWKRLSWKFSLHESNKPSPVHLKVNTSE